MLQMILTSVITERMLRMVEETISISVAFED
jgi:hypothetical protein